VRASVTLLAALALAALTVACSSDDSSGKRPSPASAPMSCDSAVKHGPLPKWARTGFSPPDQDVRYVMGEKGRILGVVFGYPLQAPAHVRDDDRNNKILWVSNTAEQGAPPDLVIAASLNGTSVRAKRTVSGGPGPSIIDMPQAGCWTFDLTWSGVHDRLAVPYGS
jgi:hypothetical protein